MLIEKREKNNSLTMECSLGSPPALCRHTHTQRPKNAWRMEQGLNKYPFPTRAVKWCRLPDWGKWSSHEGAPAGHKTWWLSGVNLFSMAEKTARLRPLVCFLSLAWLLKAWGWKRVMLLLLVLLLRSWNSSCSGHLKAAQKLLLQLLQAREGKSFFAWANKTKLSQVKLNCIAPWNAWAGRFWKMPMKELKTSPSLVAHTPSPGP